ncbi:hypothetical protein [Streptomyces sparsus]
MAILRLAIVVPHADPGRGGLEGGCCPTGHRSDSRWGVAPRTVGKTVWAEIDLP